jgi:hypothetical protein
VHPQKESVRKKEENHIEKKHNPMRRGTQANMISQDSSKHGSTRGWKQWAKGGQIRSKLQLHYEQQHLQSPNRSTT